MKITKITQQVKRPDRFSVFVDDKYSFSLSDRALLSSGIASGQELSDQELIEFKQLSQDDKVYALALRYCAMRQRTTWEMKAYLERKDTPEPLIPTIIEKLTELGLIDDLKYAQSFVHDRRLLRSSSRRKIEAELRKKRLPSNIIEAALGSDDNSEQDALLAMIERKRRQSKYQDDTVLMQYLARQGYGYGDIRSALNSPDTD